MTNPLQQDLDDATEVPRGTNGIHDVGAELSALKEDLSRSHARIRSLLETNTQLVKQKETLQSAIRDIVSSKSWKLTAPLRAVATFKRSVSPLLRTRNHKLSLLPARGMSSDGDRKYSIVGSSPSLTVVRESKSELSGWARLSITIRSKADHTFFFLYFGRKGVFGEHDRILLPITTGDVSLHIFRIPIGTTDLRLDPFDAEGSFEIGPVSLTEIGTLQGSYLLTRKHVGSDWSTILFKIRKVISILRSGGFKELANRLFANHYSSNYEEWVRRYDTLTDDDAKAIREHIKKFERKPLISVIMPVFNTPEDLLRKAIESVRAQYYENWELCIADDCSSDSTVREIVEEYAALDPRIKYLFRSETGHIARASNSALSLASGDFITFLDHDDELTSHALYMVANELNEHPQARFIYSDEDKLNAAGMRFNPYFKSGWNPEFLLSQNYVCHLAAFDKNIVDSVGGFRDGVDGAQDWDLILRVAEKLSENEIRHIPHVLYHWRITPGSTAQSTSFKPYVLKAQQKVVEDHLKRRGINGADVEILENIAQLRVIYAVPTPEPKVSLIIPTRDMLGLLRTCVNSILNKTTYKNFEIIIVDNASENPETLEYFGKLTGTGRVKVIRDENPFNFARLNNLAAKHATGDILGFINNDLEVIDSSWLREMVSYVVQNQNGAVGARLLFPNNLLQHGGIVLGIGGIAGHNHKGRPKEDPGYWNRAILPQNLSAVTAACMLMRRDVFDEIGGFDEVNFSVAFNDVDLCLRVREKGYKVVYAPYAELYHHESASRGYENTPEKFARFENEIENMRKRWGHLLKNDPYYNPNLTLLTEDFSFAFPPRVEKPWELI